MGDFIDKPTTQKSDSSGLGAPASGGANMSGRGPEADDGKSSGQLQGFAVPLPERASTPCGVSGSLQQSMPSLRQRAASSSRKHKSLRSSSGGDFDDEDVGSEIDSEEQRVSRERQLSAKARLSTDDKRTKRFVTTLHQLASAEHGSHCLGRDGHPFVHVAGHKAALNSVYAHRDVMEAWRSLTLKVHLLKEERGTQASDDASERLGECRLLRNRMSAQQARERRKAYLENLEKQVKEQAAAIEQLEQRLRHVENDNATLRRLLRTVHGGQPGTLQSSNGLGVRIH